jgi:PPM family protein phosphatase
MIYCSPNNAQLHDTSMTEQIETPQPVQGTGRPLLVRVVQQTDVGRVRSENQDFAILSTAADEESNRSRGRLMIVADGMGGHRGGATASRLAGTTIKQEYYAAAPGEQIETALRHALEKANARIFSEAQANPDLRGMGTTCSALVVHENVAHFAHVGDSRIYMVSNDQIRQLTDDHSLVASMVREGLITSKEAEVHPRRNVLQRSMGVAEQVEIDVRTGIAVQPGDTFILCSDGLHGLVREEEIRQVAALPIEEAAQEFIKRAIERGAPDNVTVIIARAEEEGAEVREPSKVQTERMRAVTEEAPLRDGKTTEVPVSEELRQELEPAKLVEAPRGGTIELEIPPDAIADTSTIPDSQIVPEVPSSAMPQETASIPPDGAMAMATAGGPTVIARPQARPRAPRRAGTLKWITIILLLFVAAGAAVLYWNYWGSPSARSHEQLLGR